MPQNASWALQKAIFQTLEADAALTALLGAGKIFDDVPQGAAFPYLTIGQSTARDWSTSSEAGFEHNLTLHVWSKSHGRKQVQETLGAIHDVLHDANLTLEDHNLINLRHNYTEIRRTPDGKAYHGLTRYRAVSEPVI